ncbi:hypothetical protein CLV56_1584 [Mumia flava]|uniref:DUF5979 domain-containing protein n=1 Tax=Mumia flava TaxID=1348852 RepID=A0A0B2BJW0_9ACTN|nr:DUF5979 domain-containing protein [Mumia flava]PJJ57356.1 hypothetical protein CLV56_1584 [Mumia flava]
MSHRARAALSFVAALLIALPLALTGAVFAPALAQGTGVVSVDKSVVGTPPAGGYEPGDTFQYEIEVSCSNLDGPGCDDAQLTDTLPPPLVLSGDPAVTVSGTSDAEITEDGDNFTIDFTETLGGGVIGLTAGSDISIIVNVEVPEDASGDYDGTVTNTADVTQSNGDPASDSADVTLNIETTLAATVDKTIDPTTVPGVPGVPVEITIDSANTSNASVDSLVVQDPADGADDPFEYLAVTGVVSFTPPDGAVQVQVDWQSEDGTWNEGTPSAIPTDPNALLSGIPDLTAVHGLRITWIGDDGATIPPDTESTIVLATETRPNVADLPEGATTVDNVTSALVTQDDATSVPVTDAATVVINRTAPTVETTKTYTPTNVPSGGTTTATITSAVGSIPVTEMVIQDPAAGTASFVDQNVTFEGFDPDSIQWPANATEATIVYTYDDGTTSTETTDVPNTLPDPDAGKTVTGFTITFAGPIQANATANIAYDVTVETLPDGSGPDTSTNTTSTTVTDANGTPADDTDSATINVLPLQVETDITKDIIRTEMPGVPGASTVISLNAGVSDSSTIGSDYLQITDPSPQPPDSDAPPTLTDFWNRMDLASLGPVEIPTNTTLTVEYWSDSEQEWVTVESDIGADASPYTWTPTADEREDIAGIRLTWEPTDPDGTLPPGFEVTPYFTVSQRDTMRDGSGSALPDDTTGTLTYDNDAQSKVDNDASQDTPVYDDDDDTIDVYPVDGGPGTDLLDKTWLDPDSGNPSDAVTVPALTDDQRAARVLWGTGGFPIEQAVVADPASAGELADVSTSVFDAFDLVEIQPIDASSDPLMTFDAVTAVELYDGSGWVDITTDVCGADGAGCDGTFPGYTLDADQQASTIGVRLTFEESPTRGDRITNPATDPPVGSGVALSNAASRPVDLTFQIRQTLRSDPSQPVLGTEHDYTYNTGTAGLVDNTASLTPDDYDPSTDDALITITDENVNTTITKTFDADSIGLPPAGGGTSIQDFPLTLVTLTATNTTPALVSDLTVTDPVDGTPPTNVFEMFNLQDIVSISVPAGADPALTEVVLTHQTGTVDAPITIDEALARSEGSLATVTGISVLHHSPDGTLVAIEPDATSVVELSLRLRPTYRTSGAPIEEGDTAINRAQSDVSSPEDDATATSPAQIVIEQATYGVQAEKTIAPAERYEDESDVYTITLEGQPTGNVRTRELTISDTAETFWNAFDFTSFEPTTRQDPIAQIKTDALVGITYELDAGGSPVALCNGSEDLTGCWAEGEWTEVTGDILPVLPDGVSAAQVRGLRFSFRNADNTGWERSSTPVVPVAFTATRRDTLIIGPNGEDDTVPVPSTLPGMETAPGEDEQGRTTDTVDVDATGAFNEAGGQEYTASDSDTDSTLLRHLTNEVSIVKSPGRGDDDPPLYLPDTPIPYTITITNTGSWPQTGVTITDQIQTNEDGAMLVLPVDDEGNPEVEYTFTLVGADGTPKPTDGFTADLDEETGVLTITPPDGFVLEPGDVLTIGTPLVYQPGLNPGTQVRNRVTVSDDRTYDVCESTRNQTIDRTSELVDSCSSITVTEPLPASPIRVAKAVRGVGAGLPDAAPGDQNYDDLGILVSGASSLNSCESPNAPDGFYTYPCVPITRPGGTERWATRFTNSGNTIAGIVAGIDVLPTPGDTGVILPTDRDSEFTPTLLGNFTSDGEPVDLDDEFETFYYMTTVPDVACNEADILSETDPDWSEANYPDCYDDVESRDWIRITSATTAAELAQARAVKGIVDYSENPGPENGLLPLQTKTFTYETQTPWTPEEPGFVAPTPVAWNSIAAGARATDGSDVQNPTAVIEPRKVGVATATGQLDLQKIVDVPDGFPPTAIPPSYTMRLSCTSGPEEVSIVDADGADGSLVTVPSTNLPITVNASGNLTIPWGAECTATEEPAPQGATVTWDPAGVDPASGEVEATRDFADRGDILYKAWPDPIPPLAITATNTYELAGFSVSKTVDTGGAEDQDGEPITYDTDYDFTASCTFNGTEMIPDAEQSFSLGDGEEMTFDDLPAASECSVTETGTGGAAETSIQLTQSGVDADEIDGTTVDFVLDPDDGDEHVNAVAYTNSYTVGSVDVVKAVEGDGADDWATAPFEVEMTCELAGTSPDPVYEDSEVFTAPDDLEWSVENLPTGAECSFAETATGGATTSSIAPNPVTVGNDDVDDPAEVTVTNTFETGTIDVRKVVAGLDGQALEDALQVTYIFDLSCTRDIDGTPTPIPDADIPGGPIREVVPADDPIGEWTGLPVGAECTITEELGEDLEDPPTVLIVPDTVTVRNNVTARFEVINSFEVAPLTVEKVVDGDAADVAPAEFDAEISCSYATADGDIPLVIDPDDPDAAPGPLDVTIEAGGSFTTADMPVGANCTVRETDDGGATSTTITGDGEVVVAVDGTTATITNTFDDTGLVLGKQVDPGGAVDSDGDPIAYDLTYTFSALCTFNDQTVLDTEVELGSGESQEFDGLPVGSDCTVTETDDGGAKATALVVTQSGTESEGDGDSVSFTLTAGGAELDAVTATNTYGAGGLRIRKVVDGTGAGPFTLRVRCTLDAAAPDEVRDERTELAGGETWAVDDVPAGAECTVTEPRSGGADAVAIDPGTVTVDDGSNVRVTVTNTFDPPPGTGAGGGADEDLPWTGSPVTPGLGLLGLLTVLLGGLAVRLGRSLRQG